MEFFLLHIKIVPTTRQRHWRGKCWTNQAARKLTIEVAGVFSGLWRKGCDVDKRFHIRLTVRRVADHHAAIGMPDQHDWRVDVDEKGTHGIGVALDGT
jgi:predicted secreted protein